MILQTQQTNTFITLAFSILVAFLWTAPADAANCAKKPDHPQCTGGGGGEDPPPEPIACADSQSFPAFVYWDDQGNSSTTVLTVSDAEGACKQALSVFDTEHFITGETLFQYDPVTAKGRVVWTNHFVADFMFLTEFDVDENNVIDVWKEKQEIINLQGPEHAYGTMRNLDISLNGDLITFIYRPKAPADYTGGYTIYTASIDGCAYEPWVPPIAGTNCNDTLVEIISADPVLAATNPNGTFYWRDISLSTDDSKIYLDQFINALGGGTYVLEENDEIAGTWDLTRLVDLPFPSDIAHLDYDGNGATDVLATGGSSETNPCGELILVDIDDCLSGIGSCSFLPGQGANVLGRNASWMSDGRLVYEERIYNQKGRNYSCSSGNIQIASPLLPNSDPVDLMDGRDPEGS